MTDPHDPGVPRLAHEPLNDRRPNPPSAPNHPIEPTVTDLDPGSFRFDLDRALARLTEPHQVPRFTWSAVTPAGPALAPPAPSTASQSSPAPPRHPAPVGAAGEVPGPVGSAFPDLALRDRPPTQPTAEPLPEIREATPTTPALSTALWNSGSPTLAPAAAPAPFAEPVPVASTAPLVVTGSQAFAAGTAGFSPAIPYAPNAVGVIDMPVGDGAPRLPDVAPAAAPSMATMVAPTAVPSAIEERAKVKSRKQRKKRRLGRYVMVVMLLGGLAAGALVWGPGLLFPEDWDKEVVPTVEALQTSTGLEFDEPVGITTLARAEYAAKAAGVMFGADLAGGWTAELPRWRALGLGAGEPTVESVSSVVGAWLPAFYDAESGQIFRDANATGRELDTAMRNALAAALVAEQDPEPTPAETGAGAAGTVDTPAGPTLEALAVSDVRAELVAPTTEADRTALDELPVPLAHRLLAIEDVGAPILTSLGVAPDQATALAGFDGDVDGLLDVPVTAAPVAALLEGDVADGDAAARGSDFWFGVLASYLPAPTAADAADAIGADLYTPAVRGSEQCVYGTFTPATPDLLPLVQIAAIAWAEAAPTQAGAQATTLADGITVQLSSCDPGAAPDALPAPGVAAALVARQIARL